MSTTQIKINKNKAIVVNEVDEEYKYIAKQLGPLNITWKLIKQKLINNKKHWYDLIEIELLNNGKKINFVFDVSSTFKG